MRTVLDDLAKDGLADNPEVSVVGWSMGGLFTAYLAGLESKGELGFTVDTLLAVNPPVDSEHVLSVIDSFMSPARSWTREQAIEKFVDVAPRLLVWDGMRFDATPDISEEDARYTVAALLVATLPELVGYVEHAKTPVSFRQYFERYVQDQGRPEGAADAVRHVGLKTLENVLRGNPRVKMIHTRDDFLLDAGDRAYLDKTLGDRLIFLGNVGVQDMHLVVVFFRGILDHGSQRNNGILEKVVVTGVKDRNGFTHACSPLNSWISSRYSLKISSKQW
jgi:pimeloyl-ACP methyl ester carboxylesterase